MRRLFLGFATMLALAVAAPAATAPTATSSVQIKRTGFVPASVTINADDAVSWKNVDTIDHQVVANGGSFASPILKPGATYTHTFRSGGTFRYHDGLHPGLKGTVVVRGAPPQVSLAASAAIVKFGTTVTLSGAVSNKRAGETVTLVSQPFGQPSKQVIATLQTGADGAFSFSVTPEINTSYQVQWRSSESSVQVQVMPMIKLPAPARNGTFHFFVTAGTSFAGHFVFLQRFTALGQWVSIRKLVLGTQSGRIVTLSSIRAVIPRGRWSIRVLLPADQAGPGYLESRSGTQPVVRK